MEYKDIISSDKEERPQHFKFLLHKNKDIIGPFLNPDLTKQSIEFGPYISDSLVPVSKDKTNVLFAGCSITVACGLNDIKKSWSYKLYDQINEHNPCSGYFNVGLSGGSTIEIILNVFKYISKYGYPDYIFILFPNYGRDWFKFNTFRGLDGTLVEIFIFNLYSILEDMCKNNNVKLFSTGWSDLVPGVTDFIDTYIPDFEEYMHRMMKDSFNTYYQINKERFTKNTFDFIQNNDQNMTIVGSDNTHPSEAVHYAWFKEAVYRIKEVEDVDNGN